MELITRNVLEISLPDRQALEHVLGRALTEDQQIVFQISIMASTNEAKSNESLPTWCNV